MASSLALAIASTTKRFRLVTALFVLFLCLLALFTYNTSALIHSTESLTSPAPPAAVPSQPSSDNTAGATKWSRFAYAQYVTDGLYLCNSVMFFAMLHKLGSQPDRVMMYPAEMLPDPKARQSSNTDGRLLIKARDLYGVKLSPITVQHKSGTDPTWADSFTKLLVFNQTQYDRVLCMDSDSTILQNIDELFLLPPAPVAMPRAYWLLPNERVLSSQLILVQPSAKEFDRVQKGINNAGPNDYDMEIMNKLYGDSALVIPHRPYNLLTGEFRQGKHAAYLGNSDETWDPVLVFNEAKFVHFSDYPVPKPWLEISKIIIEQHQPDCQANTGGQEDCSARQIWNDFYTDFKDRRQVCVFAKMMTYVEYLANAQ